MIHCEFCQQAFVLKKYLAAHITRVHKVEALEVKESKNDVSRYLS